MALPSLLERVPETYATSATCYTEKAFLVPRLMTKLHFLTGDLLTRAPQFGQLFFTYSKLSRRGGRLAARDSRIRKNNKTKNFVLKEISAVPVNILPSSECQRAIRNCPELYLLDAHMPYAHRL